MSELENELVHYTVNAHRPAYKLQLGVVGIVVDEIVDLRQDRESSSSEHHEPSPDPHE